MTEFTREFPKEHGHYWLKRDGLKGTAEIVTIHGSESTIGGSMYVAISLMVVYRMSQFCDDYPNSLWCGPLEPPTINEE